MKKIAIVLLGIFLLSFTAASSADSSSEVKMKKFLEELISGMTLEEKIGQMTQLALQAVSEQPRKEGTKLILKVDKLREAIVKYHVGSILESGAGANTIEDWHKIITTIQNISTKETRLGIPVLYGIDAIHGANFTKGATIFPQAIAMAATRNLSLIEKAGEITALEVRASGIPWNFNPVLGVGRKPLWSRYWETFGEDTYMVTQAGKAYINGLQGSNTNKINVAACMKHYIGYSNPNSGIDRTPAWIPERILREIFLPPFEEAVKQGCLTVMINSSEVNGIPVHSDSRLINGILKKELGFKGFAVSDWEDIKRLHTRDHVADSQKEAVRLAVMAGLDMSMVPMDFSFYNLLLELVKEGSVPVSRIDDAVYRILRVKYLVGLFENPYPDNELVKKFASKEFSKINLTAAQEAVTLLKNDDSILPLDKNTKVLVTGPTADLMSVLNGGWTITWQGDNEALYPKEKFTILEAIQNKIGNENVLYGKGIDFDKDIDSGETIKLSAQADVIVLCLGEPTYCEGNGNIYNLEITKTQIDYAKSLYKTGKPVILILIEGRPRVLNKIVDESKAIIMAYLPGMEGGQAIADVLFGDVNPSGKLPFSYPKYVNGFTTYDHKPIEDYYPPKYNPQWPFGFGLSYTTFKYSNLKLNKDEFKINEIISVSVDVTNTGKKQGKETVELYLSDLYASVSPAVKKLKRFKKISLLPGETKTVSFQLNQNDFSFYGRDNKKTIEPGEFKITVNNLHQILKVK